LKTTESSEKPADLRLTIAHKLKYLRETVRKMSPEDLERRVAELGGEASSSYIRRLEKGENAPTVEMLQNLLEALGSNIGLFFEEFIDDSAEIAATDRRYQRILQRALESPQRSETIAIIRLLDRALSSTAPVTRRV
jgi:transcriptional regulator with XRE-family HTH domain